MALDSKNNALDSNDKKKSLEIAMKQIERQFGKNSIMKLGEGSVAQINTISTGSLSIDVALGVGGLPCGRVVELYGNESSGKTTIALSVIAQCQKAGGTCAFIDAEHALDPEYSRNLGVNIDELLISQPDHGEQALEICDTLVRSGGVDLIVVDSVAALVPKAELTGEMEDQSIGLQARLMSKALRKITGSINRTNTVVLFINQIRMKIGTYGNPETTTGGNALKFYASVRMEVRKGKVDTKGEEMIGMETKVKVVKNKMASPFKVAQTYIKFGYGINNTYDIIELAENYGIIQKAGSWYSYNGERIGQGRDFCMKHFEENPSMLNELDTKIREKALLKKDKQAEKKAEEAKED